MSLLRVLFAIVLLPLSFAVQATDESHDHEVAAHLKLGGGLRVSQEQAHDIISAANWAEATRLELLLHDDYYEPEELVLEAGKTYRLVIENVGFKRHDISSEQFFSNIVVKTLRYKGLLVGAYHLESISLAAGDVVEVEMVTAHEGEFPFICTVQNHLHEGMEGLLTVVNKSSAEKAVTEEVHK